MKSDPYPWRGPFLAALAQSANVRLACKAAGVSREMAYRLRRQNKAFAAAWQTAMAEAVDILDAEARRRALSVSDTLLIFLLKAHRPEMYRERIDVRVQIDQERQRVRAQAEAEGLDPDLAIAEFERILAESKR